MSKLHSLFSISSNLISTQRNYISSLRESKACAPSWSWDQCAPQSHSSGSWCLHRVLVTLQPQNTPSRAVPALTAFVPMKSPGMRQSCTPVQAGREAEQCLLCPAFKPLPCTDLALPGPVSQPCHLPFHRHCISLHLQFSGCSSRGHKPCKHSAFLCIFS